MREESAGLDTALQVADLQELECRIEKGLQTFIDVGNCLLEIRDRRLYKEQGYGRFEDYCQERWGWSRERGRQLIEGAKVATIVGNKVPVKTESQARELTPLVKADEQEAVETWNQLREEHGDKVTASTIRTAVQEKLQPLQKTAAQLIVSSNSNEWYTPDKYIQAACRVMGCIDTDPATSFEANEAINAESIYTAEDNGLEYDWPGRVWLNPPYGGLTEAFVTKLIKQHEEGTTTEAILLVNSHATDTKWFQPLWDYLLCFTDHRVNFNAPTGAGVGSTHGSVFVYFGENRDRFFREFSEFGVVVARFSP